MDSETIGVRFIDENVPVAGGGEKKILFHKTPIAHGVCISVISKYVDEVIDGRPHNLFHLDVISSGWTTWW